MFLLLFPFLYHFITHFDLNASLLLFVSVVHWKGEHHVSLVSLACPFLLVAMLSTPSSNIRQSLKIIMVSFPFGFVDNRSQQGLSSQNSQWAYILDF